MAKKSRVWDGTAWQELASAQTDLTAYSTTAQMNTAITAGVGLVPILTQTIGTAVSSVVVNNAFSATYDAYKIIITGGVGSAEHEMNLILGATVIGYYRFTVSGSWANNTVSGNGAANTTSFSSCAIMTTNSIDLSIELRSPFAGKPTHMTAFTAQSGTTGKYVMSNGYLNNTTSYTGFTLTPNSGTMTGGTIRVYGYKN